MAPGIAPTPVAPVQATRAELLRRFVQAYWLRPENALWMTLRSEILSDARLEHPFIDLACGDGVFSFLHCGGVFDPTFDVFTSIAESDGAGYEHPDMFDCLTDDYQPLIVSPSLDTIDVGTDIKRNMLAKARLLNLYDRLVEHDNNRPLPFDDDSFQTVYCNAAYWVADVDRFLREMARITRPDGRVILQVKLDGIRDYTLRAHREILGDRLLDIIDRGRSASWPTIADQATWEARFAASGLGVEAMRPFITRTHAHIWDIGLRPIAPLLAKMAGAIAPQTREAIKREWVDLFCELLEPFCDPGVDFFAARNGPAEVQYLLRPT